VYIVNLKTISPDGNGSVSSTAEINDSTSNGPTLTDEDRFGTSVANIGDLDNDGVDDIVVGARADDNNSLTDNGAVHIMFLNTDGSVDSTVEINDVTANGPVLSNGDRFGISVANIGDLNKDGVNDIAVGALDDNGGTDRGAIHIMFMDTDGSIDSATVEINSASSPGPSIIDGDFFGASITNIGDLDNDGVDDLAVGARDDDDGGTDRGAVHIMYMNTDGSIDSTVEINSATSNGPVLSDADGLGNAIANIGDLNNDGVNDIAVAANKDDAGGDLRGTIHIMFMNTNGSIDSTVEINSSTSNGPTLSDGDRFGASIVNMGDLNNDGVADIAVGANSDDGTSTDRGAIHIMFLNTDGSVDSTIEINDSTTNGPTLADSDLFAGSISNMGDLNNDGVADILSAAERDDDSGTDKGAAHVLFLDKTTIVTNLNSTTTDGTYSTIGNVIDVVTTFSEAVTVSGTPQLTLETGTTDRVLDYVTGSGTSLLTFQYTVQSGDSSSDLDYVATTSLSSGTSITSTTSPSNNAVLTLPTPGELGSIGFNQALVISSPASPSAGGFLHSITNADGVGGAFAQDIMYNVAVNSTNHIFAAMNSLSDSIIKFSSSGIFQSTLSASNMNPHSVTHDSNNRIIVASDGVSGNAEIFIFNTDGTVGTPASFDGDDGANEGSVDSDGFDFQFPHDVEVDSSDNIYVMDKSGGSGGNRLQKYSSSGTFISSIESGTTGDQVAFSDALGLAVDSNGRIIILDRGTSPANFQIFDSSGTFVKRITDANGAGGTFSSPHDIEVDSHDRIYVADQSNHRIQVFESDGTFLTSISAASPVAPTSFSSPAGVEIDGNGRIIVADTNNERIQIFQKLDDPVTETETTQTQAEISAASDSDSSTQEVAEAAAAKPDEAFVLEEEEYAEVVAESLATPIVEAVEIPIAETFEEVKAPEKVEAAVEDTSFKILTKKLSKSDDKEDDAKKLGLEYKDGDVRALVILDKTSDAVINEIKKYAYVESTNKDLVQINIPLDDLTTLYKIPDITKVQPTSKAIQSVLTSQGYDNIQAQIPHGLGVQADGIKIAVLDLAFDVTNDEIKNNVKDSKTFRHDFDGLKIPLDGFGHESIHGTAVSEIVIDVAPKAELFLYTFAAEVEFLDAMDYAMEQDVDLITMSAGWVNYPTDGTSEMTKKVEQAISQGIPFVVSAGNYAETHWEGKYVDFDDNGWHEFAPSDEGISVVASEERVAQQIPFVLYLMWDSPSGSVYDFDLSMTDEEGDVIAYSANLQESKNAINFEYVYFTPEEPGTYSLGILYGGTESPDVTLELFSPSDKLEYPVSAGSVSVPTDAKGVISVGALNYYDSRLEPFSSQGPTNHCVQAPSVMGPDAVATLAYDKKPFYGTSAAAPHVAGIVALMLDKTPQLTPLQILSELVQNSNTEFSSYENLNNVFGFGAADSEFIAELDEIVTPIELDDGCMLSKSQTSERYGDSDQQSKFAVAGVITQQGIDAPVIPIPEWVKKNAGWWSDGTMNDDTFTNAIEFLIEKQILDIPMKENISEVPKDKEKHEFEEIVEVIPIPDWIKNNAGWWSDGTINDDAFVSAIQYLVEQGIIDV